MRKLLTIDSHDYNDSMPVFEKYTVRAIIEKDGKYSMQQSSDGEYKIPGGGIEPGESMIEALNREVLEETGLIIKNDTVREIGEILEVREDLFVKGRKYICHSYFFFCEVEDRVAKVNMTESEIAKGFHPVWAEPSEIISENKKHIFSNRDTRFMEMLYNNEL